MNKRIDTYQGLTFDYSYQADGSRPIYKQYPQQSSPQPGYLQLSESGEVSVGYNPEIGTAVPMRVHNRLDLRWEIPSALSRADIDAMLSDAALLSDLARIHAGRTVAWNGSNRVGTWSEDISEVVYAVGGYVSDWPVSDMSDQEQEELGIAQY